MTLKVAIPDTTLTDCSNLREKTTKLGRIARALAVFRVEEVLVYSTSKLRSKDARDVELIVKILTYMNTPQYLRRRVYPHSSSLKYAGILPPLRISSHPLRTDRLEGAYRWGLQISPGKIDIGLDQPVTFNHPVSERTPTLFHIKRVGPPVIIELAEREEVPVYWGFEVRRAGSLESVLEDNHETVRLGFSRNAPPFKRLEHDIRDTVIGTGSVLAVFGGPTSGILDLASDSRDSVKAKMDIWANTIPDQGTATVRLDEAILISLGLLNALVGDSISKPGYYSL
ncbi:MAG: putative RNA uridine N3 methyltransferase [Candidatus Thorarchaeota archaeon]